MQELHAILSGRVQMVMMRDFVQRKARGLKLTGWVTNLPDRTVQVVAQGDRARVEKLLKKLHRGPLLARVDKVVAEWRESKEKFTTFDIWY